MAVAVAEARAGRLRAIPDAGPAGQKGGQKGLEGRLFASHRQASTVVSCCQSSLLLLKRLAEGVPRKWMRKGSCSQLMSRRDEENEVYFIPLQWNFFKKYIQAAAVLQPQAQASPAPDPVGVGSSPYRQPGTLSSAARSREALRFRVSDVSQSSRPEPVLMTEGVRGR